MGPVIEPASYPFYQIKYLAVEKKVRNIINKLWNMMKIGHNTSTVTITGKEKKKKHYLDNIRSLGACCLSEFIGDLMQK